MFVNKAMQLAVLAAAMMWETRTDAATTTTMPTVRLCGRKLSEIMSKVCIAYNDPTVVEQHTGSSRRKRQLGIADECCTYGCTWEQLNEYCAISKYSESPLAAMEKHTIADRSAEQSSEPEGGAALAPASGGASTRREVGRRSRGYGRARGRRCRCRRKRRSGRRRSSLMGNMALIRSVARAAPVVGTVSPLLTWGRTLNTDLPPVERDRYAYVAVYA